MYTYSYNENSLTELLNQGREIFVKSLRAEGFLTEEEARDLLQNYAFVVRKKGWFGRTYDRVRGISNTSDKTSSFIEVLKHVPQAHVPDEPSEEPEEETVEAPVPTSSPANRFDLE